MTLPLPGASSDTVRASVKVGSGPLATGLRPDLEHLLVRVVVDTSVHGPGSFELCFLDEAGHAASDAGLTIGTAVEVHGGAPGSSSATRLICGEVTSIEAVCADLHVHTVVRGYEKAHRLQRGRRTRTFVNMTDADIARSIAGGAGLEIGTVDDTRTTHTHLAQVAETDWAFLRARAAEIGFEVGVAGGEFHFRRPAGRPAPSGGGLGSALAAVGSAIASALGGGPPVLTFKENLRTFLPRVSAAGLTPDVEVRFWDPDAAAVVVGSAPTATGTATLEGQDPAALAAAFGGSGLPLGLPLPSIPGLPSLGVAPSPTAWAPGSARRRTRPRPGSPTTSPAASRRPRAPRRATRGSRPAPASRSRRCPPCSRGPGRSAVHGTSSTSARRATRPASSSVAATTAPCSGSRAAAGTTARRTASPVWSAVS
jgi:hypothetical protein